MLDGGDCGRRRGRRTQRLLQWRWASAGGVVLSLVSGRMRHGVPRTYGGG